MWPSHVWCGTRSVSVPFPPHASSPTYKVGVCSAEQVLQERDRLSTIRGLAFLSFFYKYPAHFLSSCL